MPLFLILSLLIAGVSIVFALQNTEAISIQFLFWTIESQLALVLVLTLVAGVAVGILISLPSVLRAKRAASRRKKEAKRATRQAQEAEAALADPPPLDEEDLPEKETTNKEN